MHKVILLSICVVFHACVPDTAVQENPSTDTVYHKKTDVVYETETVHVHKQQVYIESKQEQPAPQPVEQKKKEQPQPTPVKPAPMKKAPDLPIIQQSKDTEYVYYQNPKRISVKISPWKDGKRTLQLFAPNGTLSYTFKDARHSYVNTTTLYYRKDGSVEKAAVHLNPGASMYWYETEYTFSNTNEPINYTSRQFPERTLEFPDTYLWDSRNKKWVKQQTINCQPTPLRQE